MVQSFGFFAPEIRNKALNSFSQNPTNVSIAQLPVAIGFEVQLQSKIAH
jgi:hypothetical protein